MLGWWYYHPERARVLLTHDSCLVGANLPTYPGYLGKAVPTAFPNFVGDRSSKISGTFWKSGPGPLFHNADFSTVAASEISRIFLKIGLQNIRNIFEKWSVRSTKRRTPHKLIMLGGDRSSKNSGTFWKTSLGKRPQTQDGGSPQRFIEQIILNNVIKFLGDILKIK